MNAPLIPLADDAPVTRRYLVKKEPDHLPKRRRIQIRLGYILQDETREVRLRVLGRDYFLGVKQTGAPTPDLVEIPLNRAQFDRLWPMTAGHRIEMQRMTVSVERHPLQIDHYLGDHAPLTMAQIHFDSESAAEKFPKIDWLGEEVTDRIEYRNASLAVHGLPDTMGLQFQIGALPFLYRRDRLHVVLVTNSSQTRWILPKGQPESHMNRADVALMEAFEEAGVIGEIVPGVRGRCTQPKRRTLYVLPLRVSTILRAWPESNYRKRQIIPLAQAIKQVNDKALAGCIRRMVARLTEPA